MEALTGERVDQAIWGPCDVDSLLDEATSVQGGADAENGEDSGRISNSFVDGAPV